MWLKLFFLLLYFLVLFVLARFFEAIVWYETGIFATQLVDPVALSFKKLKTILECRGLGYSGLPEKKDVRELVEKSGDLMEGELYSALKEEEAAESVSSTNFSGEMHFYELVEDTKDGIWLVQVIANDRSPLVGKIHWEKMVKKVSRFGIRTGTFNCSSDPSTFRGWPRGRVVEFARSAAGGPVFRWFESWVRTWHCSSDHAEAASHMPQLEGPTTKNIQLCTGGLWGEKGKK
ncbi:E3 ubiquitin-protein ligase RNF103 isoform X4 [Equus asinus]